ncbi:MAG: hypothetical protein IBX61_05300 [Thermoleophilia bacterium]|nr:hypothetical protein [Thermoleophilia bacterium]
MATASCIRPSPPADDTFTIDYRNPFGIYSPGNLDEVPMSSRDAMMEALGVGSYEAFQDYGIGLMREAGAGWARVDFYYTQAGFHETPEYMERLRTSGFEVIGGIRTLHQWEFPEDLSDFESALRALMARYPWIKIWKVGNEPNVSLVDPGEFPRIFFAGERVIREMCADCKIILAGVALRHPSEAEAKNIYRDILAGMAEESEGRTPFDVFDLHMYGVARQEDELISNFHDFRRILRESGFDDSEVEYWLTETGTYTGVPADPPGSPAQTEEDQAAELVRRFVASLGAGLSRVSWARPYENYRYLSEPEDGYYDLAGLVYNGLGQEAALGIEAGTRKLSWHAYRTLVSKVEGFSEVRELAPGNYEFAFGSGRRPVYVVWDTGEGLRPAQVLPVDEGGLVRVTDLMGNETLAEAGPLTASPVPVFIEPQP